MSSDNQPWLKQVLADAKTSSQSRPKFQISRALRFAQYAKQAYSDGPGVINLMPRRDVQCAVIREPKKVIFAFRGTTDLPGWLIDADIRFRRYRPAAHWFERGTKIHEGFYIDVDMIWPELAPIAAQAAIDGYGIDVTGHSKGGGEALPFAYRLAKERHILVNQVITFGGPRVFNRAGAEEYDSLGIPTLRVIDEDDLVCRIPWRLGLYRHVGTSAFIDAWGNIALNEPWYAHVPSDVTAIISEWRSHHGIAPATDHAIDRYIARLEKAVLVFG